MKKLFRIDVDNGIEGKGQCYCTQLVITDDPEGAKEKAKICTSCTAYGNRPQITVRAIEYIGKYRIVVEER